MCTQRTRPFAERCFRRMPMTRERTSRLPETSLRCRAEHDSRRREAGTVITLPGRGSVPRTRVRGGAFRRPAGHPADQPSSLQPRAATPSGLALRASLPGDARPVQLRVTCRTLRVGTCTCSLRPIGDPARGCRACAPRQSARDCDYVRGSQRSGAGRARGEARRGVRSVGAWQQWQRSRFARDRTGSGGSERIPAN